MSPPKARKDHLLSSYDLAVLLGMTHSQIKDLLRQVSWLPLARPIGLPASYDPRLLEVLRALHHQPHRSVGADDWLTDYLGDTDARRPERTITQGQAQQPDAADSAADGSGGPAGQ
jgi:hypothetical protein